MKAVFVLCFSVIFFTSCHKDNNKIQEDCNIEKVRLDNAMKVTISNGVWGTVSSIEGDCMPIVPPGNSSCRHCPQQRTVKIYQYTTLSDAVTNDPYKIFFDSFNTQLITQVDTDENGFFQADIPAGHYSIVIVENGKLYPVAKDSQGGLCPFTLITGTLNTNLVMIYKAVF